jgi:hypothetical protein
MIAGIPIFAILKIICTRIFRWFKRNSSWYTDEDIIEEESQAPKNPQPEPISDVTKDSEKNHK